MKLFKLLLISLTFLFTGCYSQLIVTDTAFKNDKYKVMYRVPSTECLRIVYPHYHPKLRPYIYREYNTNYSQCHTRYQYIWIDRKPFTPQLPNDEREQKPRSNYRPDGETQKKERRERKPVIRKRN